MRYSESNSLTNFIVSLSCKGVVFSVEDSFRRCNVLYGIACRVGYFHCKEALNTLIDCSNVLYTTSGYNSRLGSLKVIISLTSTKS